MGAPAVQIAREGRRERKKRELREHIFETASQLFMTNGFEATTVEQIANAADIAPATFFNHFQSKNAVLADMTRAVFDRIEALIAEQLFRPGRVDERIHAFIEVAISEIDASRDLARNVLLELTRRSAATGAAVPYLQRVYDPFTKVLDEGQSDGSVRSDMDARFLAEIVVGLVNAALVNWMNDADYPLVKRLGQTAAFVGEIIAPPPTGRPRP